MTMASVRKVLPALVLASALAVRAPSSFAYPVQAQQQPQTPTPPRPAAPDRVFGSDAGIILNPVKPAATADFEAVMVKLKEALAKSKDPTRQQQAKSWRIFRAKEPGIAGSVLYVFIMDPAVKGADYSVTQALTEAFPTEVQVLYEKYSNAIADTPTLINLTLVAEKPSSAGMTELTLPAGR